MISKLRMHMSWKHDDVQLSWTNPAGEHVTVPVTIVNDVPLVPREVGEALMEALAEVEQSQGCLVAALTADEQEELYDCLVAALGGDEEDEEMNNMYARLQALIDAHPPAVSRTSSSSGRAPAQAGDEGTFENNMHVDDLQEVNLQEAIRRSLCDEPQTPQQTQGPEANREEVISSAEPLALADQEVFVKDFREQVMQRAAAGQDIAVNDEVRRCLDLVMSSSSSKKMTAKQHHESHHAQYDKECYSCQAGLGRSRQHFRQPDHCPGELSGDFAGPFACGALHNSRGKSTMRYLAVFTATLDAGKEIPHLETLKMQSEETSAAVQMLLDLVSDDAKAQEDDEFTSHVQHVVDLCERGDYDA
ncbi:unnamed protein product, partial [Symbiodinium sp. CCMP2456]